MQSLSRNSHVAVLLQRWVFLFFLSFDAADDDVYSCVRLLSPSFCVMYCRSEINIYSCVWLLLLLLLRRRNVGCVRESERDANVSLMPVWIVYTSCFYVYMQYEHRPLLCVKRGSSTCLWNMNNENLFQNPSTKNVITAAKQKIPPPPTTTIQKNGIEK